MWNIFVFFSVLDIILRLIQGLFKSLLTEQLHNEISCQAMKRWMKLEITLWWQRHFKNQRPNMCKDIYVLSPMLD